MASSKSADLRPYEQELWHSPTIKSQGLWREPSYKFGTIPEPLYRLRLSVLNDNQGRDECPTKIYVRNNEDSPYVFYVNDVLILCGTVVSHKITQIYPTLETLTNATNEIYDTFGGSFPECRILYSHSSMGGGMATEEAVMAGVEDPRTRCIELLFDPQSADESWAEFVGRVENLEKRWTMETDSE